MRGVTPADVYREVETFHENFADAVRIAQMTRRQYPEVFV